MLFKDFTWSPEDLISLNSFITITEDNPETHVFIKTDSFETNTQTIFRSKLIPDIFPPKQPIWITGMSDYLINEYNTRLYNGKYLKLYGTNIDILRPTIQAIPLGVNTHTDDIIDFAKVLYDVSREPTVLANTLAYMNFNPYNYLPERGVIHHYYSKEKWVVDHINQRIPYKEYFENVKNHKFTFCPRGNGIDTHRFWETLYLGSIPIVLDYPQMSYFFDRLPVVRLKAWSNLTEELLEYEYERIHETKYDFSILKMGYWKNMILDI
jgi:hypothetical protein